MNFSTFGYTESGFFWWKIFLFVQSILAWWTFFVIDSFLFFRCVKSTFAPLWIQYNILIPSPIILISVTCILWVNEQVIINQSKYLQWFSNYCLWSHSKEIISQCSFVFDQSHVIISQIPLQFILTL